ncbi:MAG: hypothetical protein ABSG32_12380 [Terriglobia bacterium]
MSGNRELINKRLGKLGLRPQREEEIFRELGEHLADHAAAREALESVSNWPELRLEILAAETEEMTMNYQVTYRTKILWLPALGALTLSTSLLAIFQFFGLVPRFYWLSDTRYHLYFTFYLPWLIALPAIGAGAALWSQRAGGKAIHRLLAALAPPLGMLGFFLISPFISLLIYMLLPLFTHRAAYRSFAPPDVAIIIPGVLILLVSWVLLPAVGLLLGAAPFLRKPQPQS